MDNNKYLLEQNSPSANENNGVRNYANIKPTYISSRIFDRLDKFDQMQQVAKVEVNRNQFFPDITLKPRDQPDKKDDIKSKKTKGIFPTAIDQDKIDEAKEKHNNNNQTDIFDTAKWEQNRTTGLATMSQLLTAKVEKQWILGKEAEKAEKYADAISLYNKCILMNTKFLEAYVRRAECYLQLCDFQSAILNYKRCCMLDSKNVEFFHRLAFLYYFYGQCLFDEQRFPEALDAFSKACDLRPEMTVYHMRTIVTLAAMDRIGECLALVNKQIDEESESNSTASLADLFIVRARLHKKFHNVTLCYYDVKDALLRDAEHVEANRILENISRNATSLKNEAVNLNIKNRLRDALQKISLAIETDPSRCEFHLLRGALHRRLGDFNSAIDDFLLALDKNEHDEESEIYRKAQRQLLLTYNDFAVECLKKKFYEEAIILLNKAIKSEKNEKSLYINRGDCFFKQSEFTFALQDYQQALELDAKESSLCERIGRVHYELGCDELEEKNYGRAEVRFNLAIKHAPKYGPCYFVRSHALYFLEKFYEAKFDLAVGILLDANNGDLMTSINRLFPGKSMNDILDGEFGQKARDYLGMEERKVVETISDKEKKSNMAASHHLKSDYQFTKNDINFLNDLANKKKSINKEVKGVLKQTGNLKYTGGRIGNYNALTNSGKTTTDGNNKSGGWKKFNSQININ